MLRDDKIYQYWDRKRDSSETRNIPFALTVEDIEYLLTEAGIDIDDIGHGKGKYCLGRIGDKGPYTRDNCRFITQEENGYEYRATHDTSTLDRQNAEHGAKGSKWGFLGPLRLKKKEVLKDFSLVEKRKRALGLVLYTPATLEELIGE
jgi:hypothetical protein